MLTVNNPKGILIHCDFPGCGLPFTNVKKWAEHYAGHSYGAGADLLLASKLGHDKMLEAIKFRTEMIKPGLRIIGKEVGVWKGRIDLIAKDNQQTLYLIDATRSSSPGRKYQKMRDYRDYIRKMAMKVFGIIPPKIELYVVTPNGVVHID